MPLTPIKYSVLDGVSVTCSDSAPIYVKQADKVFLTLADGTTNTVTDGATYTLADGEDEPNAAIFSKSDLTINGAGALTVTANYKNGIASKDDLVITGGTITVTAVNDGLRGRDSVAICDDAFVINAAQGDGIQYTEKGWVSIDSLMAVKLFLGSTSLPASSAAALQMFSTSNGKWFVASAPQRYLITRKQCNILKKHLVRWLLMCDKQ